MILFMFDILLHGGWIGRGQFGVQEDELWHQLGPALAWTRVWVMGNGQAPWEFASLGPSMSPGPQRFSVNVE